MDRGDAADTDGRVPIEKLRTGGTTLNRASHLDLREDVRRI